MQIEKKKQYYEVGDVRLCLAYSNGQFNLSLTGLPTPQDEEPTVYKTADGAGEFRVRHNEQGVYQFGYWCYDKAQRPGHGGVWSSNAAAVGAAIGEKLVAVVVHNQRCGMRVEDVQKYLPEGFVLDCVSHVWGDEWEIQKEETT